MSRHTREPPREYYVLGSRSRIHLCLALALRLLRITILRLAASKPLGTGAPPSMDAAECSQLYQEPPMGSLADRRDRSKAACAGRGTETTRPGHSDRRTNTRLPLHDKCED